MPTFGSHAFDELKLIMQMNLSQLEWYRMGGEVSDRQWRDILGVLKTKSEQLDLAYLRKWAKELRVEDLLERALQEV